MAFLRVLTNRRVLIFAAVIAGLVAIALWPKTTAVDVTTANRGPLVVTVDEEGRTRVRDRFVVAAPVAGRVRAPTSCSGRRSPVSTSSATRHRPSSSSTGCS